MHNTIAQRGALKSALSFIVVITAVSVSACIPRPNKSPYPSRVVSAKEGINVLLAGNARCLVLTDAFKKVVVGKPYSCAWREPGVGAIKP